MGIIKVISWVVLIVGISSVLLLVLPGIPPNFEFHSFHIEPPRKEYSKLLDSNNILDEAELYYEGPHDGIESILELDENTIISGDQTGAIFKVTGKQQGKNITHLRFPCTFSPYGGGGKEGEPECGWPLGMQLDREGNMLVMDFFGGMMKVNVKTGSYETLVPKGIVLEGKAGSTPEDLSIAKDGTIFWSDGCTDDDFFSEMLGQPSGRLIKYDPKTKTNEVLLDDIYFSNGVCVSENDEFVLVSEMGRASIRRYYLKGDKKGTSDTFVDGLPGYPDNIRPNGRGGFYVALFNVWNDEYSMRSHLFSERPLLRKFIRRLRTVLVAGVSYLKTFFPGGTNIYLDEFENYIFELRPILGALSERPKLALVAELSKTGEVLAIFKGESGKMPNLSQLTAGKKYGYLVCPFDNKIWRIKMETLRQFTKK